jgi:hypothetical protein
MPAQTTEMDEVLNQLCDADSLWGPLVFLRPPRDKPFSNPRLLGVCSSFGISHGMCANAVFALTHYLGGRAVPPIYVAPLFLALTAFVCGQLFILAWNRRALQLNRQLAWVEANQRTAPRK